jgi:hypothetical protein
MQDVNGVSEAFAEGIGGIGCGAVVLGELLKPVLEAAARCGRGNDLGLEGADEGLPGKSFPDGVAVPESGVQAPEQGTLPAPGGGLEFGECAGQIDARAHELGQAVVEVLFVAGGETHGAEFKVSTHAIKV